MFDWVFDVIKQNFTMFFDFMNSVELRPGVTFWSLLLVFMIGGSIAQRVINIVGGGSLVSAGIGIYDDYKNAAISAERDAAREAQRHERETYEYYERNRSRNWEYDKRFRKEHNIPDKKKE